jgi:rhodanese-related sulfurtransferase
MTTANEYSAGSMARCLFRSGFNQLPGQGGIHRGSARWVTRGRRLKKKNPEISTKPVTVVVYCSIGYRSAAIVDQLQDAGIGEVYNLEGGLFEWANRDRPIYRGQERVHEVHPLNRWWGMLLKRDRRAGTSGDVPRAQELQEQ